MTTCPACGSENRAGARFCDECGSPLGGSPAPAGEERKVVSVLFADLVGFTAKAEQLDPEDVRALLTPYHARLKTELERYGGTVEKFIGDAVMALFGAPVAHEDDPERAVRAALSIRDWLREGGELQARIAVTTGEALVNLSARPERGEGMASGDVVNTAARLQSAAPVNGVLVGEGTYRATSSAIDYRELPPVEAKGKAEPVRVWEALDARARFGVDLARGFDTPLVGRGRELAVLGELLTRVREERSPQLVTLVGMPGIGKSRLVYELMQMVEGGGVLTYWRQGRSLPYGDGVTFWALSEIVKAQSGILETDDADAAEEKLAAAVAELVEAEDAAWVTGHLRPLVGLGTARAPSGDRGEEAFVAWRRFFEAMAERRPLVLVLDDLQWADDGLLDFVDHLVDWASGVPLLVVATARTELLERRPGWGGGKLNTTTLALSPLSEDETERLLEPLLGDESRESVLREIVVRAGGNPLYAEQYARMLNERGADGDLPLPESVQGIVAARLDLLSRREKSLLQDAAVFGKVFWLGGLVNGRARGEVEQELRGLERKDFVQRARRSSVAGEVEYSFRHLLVRDVAYAQIPRGLRAEKHGWAGDWIASLGRADDHAEMVAYHRLEALELVRAAGGETEALAAAARTAARDAGERALALNGFGIAARHFSDALAAAAPDDPERPRLLARLGHALNLAGDPRADATLADAIAALLAAGDSAGAAEAEARLAETSWLRGDYPRQVEHLSRAQGLVRDAPPSEAKARVLAEAARFLMIARENEEAVEVGREALAIAEALGLRELEAHVLNTVGTARLEGGELAGREELERSIELAVAVGSPGVIHRGINNLANEIAYGGDLRRSMSLDAKCLETTRRFGILREVRFAQGMEVTNALLGGRWARCLELADAFVAECEAGGAHYQEIPVRCARSAVRLARDEVDGARRDLQSALARGEQVRDAQITLSALAFAVRLESELGRRDEADRLAARWLDGYGAVALRRPAFVDVVWAAPWLGRAGEIGDALAVGRQTRWHDACRAVLDGDCASAAALFGEIGCAADEAYAHLRGAVAAAAAGDDGAAALHAGRALAFYRAVGAARYVREAEAALPVSATSPPSP